MLWAREPRKQSNIEDLISVVASITAILCLAPLKKLRCLSSAEFHILIQSKPSYFAAVILHHYVCANINS